MPSWSDDEGRCHFEVNGVPCYQSPIGCPAHGGGASKPKQPTKGEREAFRRGAEAMRAAAAKWFEAGVYRQHGGPAIAETIRIVPIPEDKQ